MTYSITWLPDVLKAAGLNVQAVDGWQTRGHGDIGKPQGILCHHTCGPKDGDIRDLHVLVSGRPDLAGPLCNLGLARSGAFWVVAAGKAWHAGVGSWRGVRDGNAHLIGIEAENVGDGKDPWPAVQIDAYKRGCAAILKHIGVQPIMCAGHKEYALPHGRKDDPDFDMDAFRADVVKLMK
jgi:N-acetylmuramoyl-L-alanine amidase-like protein